jgi:hypothetical protein
MPCLACVCVGVGGWAIVWVIDACACTPLTLHFNAVRREDDDLDIDAIIEANKDTLPRLPGALANGTR